MTVVTRAEVKATVGSIVEANVMSCIAIAILHHMELVGPITTDDDCDVDRPHRELLADRDRAVVVLRTVQYGNIVLYARRISDGGYFRIEVAPDHMLLVSIKNVEAS